MPKAVSKKQAGLFGAIAAGKATKAGRSISRSEARTRLRGVKTGSLPTRKKKR